MIHYTDLEADFVHHPKGMVEECTLMARVFLLYLLGAYLFANGGQTMSLRWMTLFRDFERVWTAYYGQACLAYFYSSLDTLSRGTLRQLVGPWKLLKVSFFPFYLQFMHSHHFWLRLMYIFLLTAFILIYCKLLFDKLPCLCLANYTITSCKL